MIVKDLNDLIVTTGKLAARAGVAALISLSVIPMASAGDDSELSLSVGLFITNRDSDTRMDVSGGGPLGTPIDLESDLGIDSSDTAFRIDGYYRFNDKHRIDFSAFDLSRTGNKQIEKDIVWQGTTFPITASVNSDIDLGIYKVAYTYSLKRREESYLGLSAGLYVADISALISAENIAIREGSDVTAPMPVVGLRGEYKFSGKWSFRAKWRILCAGV